MKFSTRAAALTAALMIFCSSFSMKAHADDNGLVLPPKLAPLKSEAKRS